MRVTDANRDSDRYGYSDGDVYADSDSDGNGDCKCHADSNSDGNGSAAAYPDAKAASDASAAPDPLRLTRTLKIRELASETREFPASRWINDLAVAGVSLANPSHLQPRRMPLWSRQ